MDDENELSPIERMAISARKSGSPNERPELKAISLRLSMQLLASVDAFVSLTGQSRNTAIINLIEAGVYAVREQLEDPDQFDAVKDAILDQYLGD